MATCYVSASAAAAAAAAGAKKGGGGSGTDEKDASTAATKAALGCRGAVEALESCARRAAAERAEALASAKA